MGIDSVPVLAIDGPSGSGKGTIGQLMAEKLGWHFLDSGAVYRAVGYLAAKQGVNADDVSKVAALAGKMDIRFEVDSGGTAKVILDGTEVGDGLRTEEAGAMASKVARIPEVRAALLNKQHAFRQPPGLVADGRDMGTTVFPDAILKVFLTARPEVRAQRRYNQLKDKGLDANLPRLLGEIRDRDARDSARTASPLKPAADASILDTSTLSILEVVEQIERLLRARLDK
jgi:cytidylate kinase